MILFTTRLAILSYAGRLRPGKVLKNKTKKDPDFPRNWDFSKIFASIVQECL